MSDMCFEDFDYDREDDLHSQAAELEEEKLTSDNNGKGEICSLCEYDGQVGFCEQCGINYVNTIQFKSKLSPVS